MELPDARPPSRTVLQLRRRAWLGSTIAVWLRNSSGVRSPVRRKTASWFPGGRCRALPRGWALLPIYVAFGGTAGRVRQVRPSVVPAARIGPLLAPPGAVSLAGPTPCSSARCFRERQPPQRCVTSQSSARLKRCRVDSGSCGSPASTGTKIALLGSGCATAIRMAKRTRIRGILLAARKGLGGGARDAPHAVAAWSNTKSSHGEMTICAVCFS